MRQMKQFVILLSVVLAFSSCVHKVQKEQQVKSIVHTNPLPVSLVILMYCWLRTAYTTCMEQAEARRRFSVYSSPTW